MNPDAPPSPTRGFLPWLTRRAGRQPLTARRAVGIIILATLGITIAGGIFVRLLDHKDFGSLGQGMWWAVQTVTMVGYGDVVPHSSVGRVIGSVVVVTGIVLIALVTGSGTAVLVAQERQRQGTLEETRAARRPAIGLT